jgi:hypothetical protein
VNAQQDILTEFIPKYHVSNFHKKRCNASPRQTYRAINELRNSEIGSGKSLMKLRSLLIRIINRNFELQSKHNHNSSSRMKPLFDLESSSSWMRLGYIKDRQLTIGVIGSFWEPSPKFITLNSNVDTFLSFNKAGFAKAVLDFKVVEIGKKSEIQFETRVYAIDNKSYRKLILYWAFIAPGMWLVRKLWLLAIKKRAEYFQSRLINFQPIKN